MPSDTYSVVTTTTGILGLLPSSFLSVRLFVCLRNRSLHQKNALPSAGRALRGALQGFCTTEDYILKQIMCKYNNIIKYIIISCHPLSLGLRRLFQTNPAASGGLKFLEGSLG